jgi:hypothetical protein
MKHEEITKKLDESFNRIIKQAENNDFAIITAYRDSFSKDENILRNRNLRASLNNHQLGVHPLVGHYRECSIKGIPYNQCPADKLVDVIERSYFVVRHETDQNNMNQNNFKNFILSLAGNYDQDTVVLKIGKDINLVEPNGTIAKNLGTKATVGKLSQAYSQYVRNLDKPFIFETDYDNEI